MSVCVKNKQQLSAMADEEQRLRDIQREYLDFLDDEVSGKNNAHFSNFYFNRFDSGLIAGGPRHIHGTGEKYDWRKGEASRCKYKRFAKEKSDACGNNFGECV